MLRYSTHLHSLRGAATLLSIEAVLLAGAFRFGLGAVWVAFWGGADWLWFPCAGLGWPGGLEASMLLPMLLPSCSRLMWRTTAVALNAC